MMYVKNCVMHSNVMLMMCSVLVTYMCGGYEIVFLKALVNFFSLYPVVNTSPVMCTYICVVHDVCPQRPLHF